MKIYTNAIAAISLLTLAACAPDPDREAARQYVEAAQKTRAAKESFSRGDFPAALAAIRQAGAQVDGIAAKYPSSAVALKLASESGVKLGCFRYSDIPALAEKLEVLADKSVEPVAKTWAAAQFGGDEKTAFQTLAACIDRDENFDAAAKARLRSKMPAPVQAAPIAAHIAAAPAQAAGAKAAPAARQKLSKEALAAILKEAADNAKYCAFEISASEALLKKARIVGAEGGSEFSAILRSALAKAKQISVASLREKAFALLAAAAAESGDEALALETIALITDPNAFESVFADIANSLGKTKNYPAALSIASRLKNKEARDGFFAMLSANVASQGRMEAAIAIASRIESAPVRNGACCEIASMAYDARDGKNFLAAISKIDVSNLECLKVFLKYAETGAARSSAWAAAAAAKITVPISAKMADALNSIAAKNYSVKEDAQNALAAQIIGNFIATKNIDAALAFLDSGKPNGGAQLRAMLSISSYEFAEGKALEELRRLASEVKASTPQKINFLYLIERSGLPSELKNRLMLPLLPSL